MYTPFCSLIDYCLDNFYDFEYKNVFEYESFKVIPLENFKLLFVRQIFVIHRFTE